jgi:outer membrane protein OmpA-like peptidoglycan-associated protein
LHALLTAFVRDLKTIDAAIVKECAQELTIPGEDRPTHAKEPATTRKMQRSIWRRAALYVCLFLAVAFSAHLIRILGYDERGVGPGDGDIGAQETSARINKPEVSQANGAKAKEPDADSTRPARYLSAGVAHHSPGDEQQPQERSHSSVVDNGQPLPFSDGKLTIQFQFGTAEFREDMFDMLDGVATVMAQKRKMVILVKGYADSLGRALYNKTLSEARANAVKDYLAAKGISPLRIRTFSMGEENPLRSNATSAGRRANRRAEIEVKR